MNVSGAVEISPETMNAHAAHAVPARWGVRVSPYRAYASARSPNDIALMLSISQPRALDERREATTAPTPANTSSAGRKGRTSPGSCPARLRAAADVKI